MCGCIQLPVIESNHGCRGSCMYIHALVAVAITYVTTTNVYIYIHIHTHTHTYTFLLNANLILVKLLTYQVLPYFWWFEWVKNTFDCLNLHTNKLKDQILINLVVITSNKSSSHRQLPPLLLDILKSKRLQIALRIVDSTNIVYIQSGNFIEIEGVSF